MRWRNGKLEMCRQGGRPKTASKEKKGLESQSTKVLRGSWWQRMWSAYCCFCDFPPATLSWRNRAEALGRVWWKENWNQRLSTGERLKMDKAVKRKNIPIGTDDTCYELPAIPYLPQDKQKIEKVSHNPSTYYHGFFPPRMFVGNVSGKEKVRQGTI